MTYREFVRTRADLFKTRIDKIIEFVKAVNDWDFFTFTKNVNTTEIENLQQFDKMLKHYLDGFPLPYISNYTYFYSLKLETKVGVFIPRKETELLVDSIINIIGPKASRSKLYKILDIGTGTGAIAITLAKQFPNADVTAIDINQDAIDLATRNAASNNVNVNFINSNLFDHTGETEHGRKFDLIVSNPPYIAQNDTNVDEMVKRYEPHNALFSGPDGLDAIRAIVSQVKNYLTHDGWCALEFGFTQWKQVKYIIQTHYPKAKIKKYLDYDNNDRYVIFNPNNIES